MNALIYIEYGEGQRSNLFVVSKNFYHNNTHIVLQKYQSLFRYMSNFLFTEICHNFFLMKKNLTYVTKSA